MDAERTTRITTRTQSRQASCNVCQWTRKSDDAAQLARDHCVAYGHDVAITSLALAVCEAADDEPGPVAP
jgi:hypothetical protein